MSVGQTVLFHPRSGAKGVIESIWLNDGTDVRSVGIGELATFKVSGLTQKIAKRDTKLVLPEEGDFDEQLFPVISRRIKQFTAKVHYRFRNAEGHLLAPPYNITAAKWSEKHQTFMSGFVANVFCGTAHCTLSGIDIKGVVPASSDVRCDTALMTFGAIPNEPPIIVCTEEQFAPFSRISAMESNRVVMHGQVTNVIYCE